MSKGMTTVEPTTSELRESFNRAPLILWALKKSALARRRNEHLPTQNKQI